MRTKKIVLGATVAMLTALVSACGGGGGGSGDSTVTFVSYGQGSYQDGQEQGWLRPFEKKEGIKVRIDGPSDNAKLKAMVKSGKVTWDVMDTDANFAANECGTLLEKIDLGSMSGSFPEGTRTECGVPDALFGLIFMYNTKKYGDNPPTSLADFFDPQKFPGKRVVFGKDPSIGNLEAALLGDGVAPDQLYPLDVPRALKMYDKIKKNLLFADTYAQQQQFMVGNQADMALVVSARAYTVLKSGGKFWKPVWDHVPVTWDVLVIPKGSKHKAAAEKLITFSSQPDQAAKFSEISGAGPANVDAKPKLDDLQKEVDVFTAHQDTQVVLDSKWWAKNYDSTVQAWSTWMVG